MSNSYLKEEPLKSVAEETAYRQKYGEDEEQTARAEHGLLINGVPYGKLWDYCDRNGLSKDGDIYMTVLNHGKATGKL